MTLFKRSRLKDFLLKILSILISFWKRCTALLCRRFHSRVISTILIVSTIVWLLLLARQLLEYDINLDYDDKEVSEIYVEKSKKPEETSVLDGVYIRDVFRPSDHEIVIFYLRDFRNNVTVSAKLGANLEDFSYECYYPVCKGTFHDCTFQDYIGKLKITAGMFPDGEITLLIPEYKLEHTFNILDVRSNGAYQHEFGVVLQPAYYLADWQNIIQYMESWLANGATKFYIYHNSWTKQVDTVVLFYKALLGDRVEILPWNAVPVRKVDRGRFDKDANTRMFNLVSEAALNNALGKVKFLALMDLDEILFVQENMKLVPLLQKLLKNHSNAAQFSFSWEQASAQINLWDLKTPSEVSFHYLNHVKLVTNVTLREDYFRLMKVELVDTHNTIRNHQNGSGVWYETVEVDSEIASCTHIRRIFTTLKHNTTNEEALTSRFGGQLDNIYQTRIFNTAFASHQMSPWFNTYRDTLLTLNDCRRVTDSQYNKTVRGGLTQCRSMRGCEQFLSTQEYFIHAENSWTNLATRFDVLSDIFHIVP